MILLLIPLLHVLELIPFYIQNADYKLSHLQNLTSNPDIMVFDSVSLIPNFWHYFIQLSLGIVLMSVTFSRTLKYRRTAKVTSRRRKLVWINWISLFLGSCFGILLLLLWADTEAFHAYIYGTFLFMTALLIVFLGLFLEPHVLYGTIPSAKEQKHRIIKPDASFLLSREEQVFKELLDNYFNEESGFLNPNFRLSDLAEHLNLSKNTLSYLINKVYTMNFNQLLNEKRIEVALKNLENSKWEHLSLEGIANEVGFKSRTTFNKAFKTKTGCTPSKYKIA